MGIVVSPPGNRIEGTAGKGPEEVGRDGNDGQQGSERAISCPVLFCPLLSFSNSPRDSAYSCPVLTVHTHGNPYSSYSPIHTVHTRQSIQCVLIQIHTLHRHANPYAYSSHCASHHAPQPNASFSPSHPIPSPSIPSLQLPPALPLPIRPANGRGAVPPVTAARRTDRHHPHGQHALTPPAERAESARACSDSQHATCQTPVRRSGADGGRDEHSLALSLTRSLARAGQRPGHRGIASPEGLRERGRDTQRFGRAESLWNERTLSQHSTAQPQ